MVLVPQGIHRLPESTVLEGHQFAVTGQALERLFLEYRCIARDPFKHLRFHDHEAAIDPGPVAGRLFLK